jgi:DNA-binding MarR family transcriptional regulator
MATQEEGLHSQSEASPVLFDEASQACRWLAGKRDIGDVADRLGLPRWPLEAVAMVRTVAACLAALEADIWTGSGVTPPGGWVLVELEASGPSRPTDLAASLLITKGGMSQLVKALEAKGLLRRKVHSTDRRSFVIELTKEGHRVVKERLPIARAGLADIEKELSTEQLKETLESLRRLFQAAHRAVQRRLVGEAACAAEGGFGLDST